MKINIINKRYKILIGIIILLMVILIINLFNVQVIKNDYYNNKLTDLTVKTFYGNSAPRGRIYDRNGNLIVDNTSVKTIYYKKNKNTTVSEEVVLAYKIADLIDVDYSRQSELMLKKFWIINNTDIINSRITDEEWESYDLRKIDSNELYSLKLSRVNSFDLDEYTDKDKEASYIFYLMNNGYYYTDKIIKDRNVTDYEYAVISENIENLNGFNVKLDWERKYLYGNVFRTILGNVSDIPSELKNYYLDLGYSLTDKVGTSYIEYQYESYLKGEKSLYKLNSNGSYTELEKGSKGNDIILTIDINLQKEVEEILESEIIKAKEERNTDYFNKAYVIINNPSTGEILAMAGKQYINGEIYDYTSGIITSSVTPGSIVKGASHIVGYNTGALKIGEIRLDQCIKIAATPLKCSYKNYGYIDDLKALKYSSNIYQFYTAINVGGGVYSYNSPLVINTDSFDIYRSIFSEFGLGVLTGIDLPNESLGYMGTNRLSGLLLDFAIGQYDTYTPIQISQYMSTIANGGYRIKPYLLKAVYSKNNTDILYEANTTILNKVNTSDVYLSRVKEGFRQVLYYGGTGYGYIDLAYNPAGKTGTSESFLDTDNDGVIDTETITSTFSGYAPYDNPEVVFTVISPDVGINNKKNSYTSSVNKRIVEKVSKKYFEIYG